MFVWYCRVFCVFFFLICLRFFSVVLVFAFFGFLCSLFFCFSIVYVV